MKSTKSHSKVYTSAEEDYLSSQGSNLRKRFKRSKDGTDYVISDLENIQQNENDDSQEAFGKHESLNFIM